MSSRRSRVTFRVDGRPEAGGGHMRRCLALARALKPRAEVAFVPAPDTAPYWADVLAREGIGSVRSAAADVAVLDGYEFGTNEVDEWRRCAGRVIMIEDLGRALAGVDLYVSPANPPPEVGRTLAGPRYALLDPGYAVPVAPRPQGGVAHVLVACGMRDSADLTGVYLDALAMVSELRDAQVTVVVGGDAPHRESVAAKAARQGARLFAGLDDLRPLYDESDLVLGAGGVSLFERMARGRASVTLFAADNQAPAAEAMVQVGATSVPGRAGAVTVEMVASAIRSLAGDGIARREMGRAARRMVDGRGAERVAVEIHALAQDVPAAATITPGVA